MEGISSSLSSKATEIDNRNYLEYLEEQRKKREKQTDSVELMIN